MHIVNVCNVFLDILAMQCRKIKPLCENILSTGSDVAGAVNVLCWVDEDDGLGVAASE